MAVAAYDSDLTSANGGVIAVGNTATDAGTWDESSDAAWDGAGAPGDESNFYINLTNCISAQYTKSELGTIIYDGEGTTHAVDAAGAVLVWSFWASPASLSTYVAGGVRLIVGAGLGDFYAWDCGGSDFEPNPLGGWYCYAINPAIGSPSDTVGTPGVAPYDNFGVAVDATAQARGYPFAVNAIRVGRCTLEVTAGQAGSYGTFSGMEAFDTSTNLRYGLFQNIYGSYRWQGLISLGVVGTAVDFRDSNVSISIANTPSVTSTFNRIEIHHADSNVEWSNVIFSSPGVNNPTAQTASPGELEVVDDATVVFDGCLFQDMATFIFQSNSTVTNSTFQSCSNIDSGGGVFTGTNVLTPTVAADSYGILWDSGTNPDGYLDDMTFSKGTNAHHAINFGTSAPTTITLRGINFSGFSASDEQNDSVLYISNTVDTITIQCIGCTGTVSYKRAGSNTVNVTQGVLTEITVKDVDTGSGVDGANVLVLAADGTNFPYNASVNITGSGTTATVAHTSHGLATGDKVRIVGANEDEYNGTFVITYSTDNEYTYTTTSAVTGSPATGTITATFAFIKGTTAGGGVISDQRVLPSGDQPIIGWARKSTASPYYKEALISDTVDDALGKSITVLLISDE